VPWSSTRTDANIGACMAAIATARASFGSFLVDRPLPNTRTRAARSPACLDLFTAASSCWANK
jgi:hypothetical protein